MQTFLTRRIQIPKRRRALFVLLNELDHERTPLAICRRVHEPARPAAVFAPRELDSVGHEEGTGAEALCHLARAAPDISNEVRELHNRKIQHRARLYAFGWTSSITLPSGSSKKASFRPIAPLSVERSDRSTPP